MLTPEQMRMGRAALGWSIRDLSRKTGVSINTISRYENGHADAYGKTLQMIRRAFEGEGVEFLEDDGQRGPGVRLRRSIG